MVYDCAPVAVEGRAEAALMLLPNEVAVGLLDVWFERNDWDAGTLE